MNTPKAEGEERRGEEKEWDKPKGRLDAGALVITSSISPVSGSRLYVLVKRGPSYAICRSCCSTEPFLLHNPGPAPTPLPRGCRSQGSLRRISHRKHKIYTLWWKPFTPLWKPAKEPQEDSKIVSNPKWWRSVQKHLRNELGAQSGFRRNQKMQFGKLDQVLADSS